MLQNSAGTVRYHLQADTAEFFTLFFNGCKNDSFTVGTTTAFAGLLTADEKLIKKFITLVLWITRKRKLLVYVYRTKVRQDYSSN